MSSQDRQRHLDRIADEASEWFERVRGAELDTADREAFAAWLKASAQHVNEYLQIAAVWSDLSDLGEDPEIEQVIQAAKSSHGDNVVALFETSTQAEPPDGELTAESARRRRLAFGALIAASAAVVVTLAVFWLPPSPIVFRTVIGEQTSFPLPDGSMVTLNTRSTIRLRFTKTHRDVELDTGEALFDVVKESARPFRVVTDGAVVQAVGTRFNVHYRLSDTTVTVVEGSVQVQSNESASTLSQPEADWGPAGRTTDTASGPVIVESGQQARVDAHSGEVAVIEADLGSATAWRERRLLFDARPLSGVIDEFNLYNDPPMVIADSGLEQLRISGGFNANDRASFVLFLEEMQIATAETRPDGTIALHEKP